MRAVPLALVVALQWFLTCGEEVPSDWVTLVGQRHGMLTTLHGTFQPQIVKITRRVLRPPRKVFRQDLPLISDFGMHFRQHVFFL